MSSGFDYRKFFVMYVDDETQSLKYFRKNFESQFRIITAEDADAALAILAEQGQEIGVLITDQRMPGKSGTELLTQTKQMHPKITRILATAYSDLDTAVESVNEGGAFRYLTKPWDLRELKGVLMRAMEYSLLQRDRDQLIREKMLVSQQIITMDRLRSIATFLGSDSRDYPQLASGLQAYLASANAAGCAQVKLDSSDTTDLWSLTRRESVCLIQAMQQLKTLVAIRQNSPAEPVDWRTAFEQSASQHPGVKDQLDMQAGATTQCNAKLAAAFADCIVRACASLPAARFQLKDSSGVSKMQLELPLSESERLADLFSLVNGSPNSSADLLDAFLAMSAMGGKTVGKCADSNRSILQLSFTVEKAPAVSQADGFDAELFERMFSTIEEA